MINNVFSIDYIEFYVGNALQAAHYYQTIWGFRVTAYKGLETGCRDSVSYLLEQGKIKLVLTASLSPDSPIARHVALHGDSVKNIALSVENATEMWQNALKKHGHSAFEPFTVKDNLGEVVFSGLHLYGDTIHTFVERKNYAGVFLPQYVSKSIGSVTETGLTQIDHCTSNVERGKMDYWMNYYERIFGFSEMLSFDENDIFTEYSALMTKVSVNQNYEIMFPIIQPINIQKKSQIQEFLEYNKGAGIQHIAFLTEDIISTVTDLKNRGVAFLKISGAYYSNLTERIGKTEDNISVLQQLNIMLDKEPDGYIYQAFTKPIVDRPTFFIEIIQRNGAKNFGKGNVKALFESLVVEQSKRGNL